jgi:hypothetical protein
MDCGAPEHNFKVAILEPDRPPVWMPFSAFAEMVVQEIVEGLIDTRDGHQ